jgi:cell division protein FtsQ
MAAGALVMAAVLVPAGFWLRDSSLVSVRHVEVIGASGPEAAQVRQAITDAADGMSTLHVDTGRLRGAVRQFPIVEGIEVRRDLPHTLEVTVRQHVPVGALGLAGRRVAVAGDGTILAGSLTKGLPLVPVGAPPGGNRLAEARALRLVALLAAAPVELRRRVSRVGFGPHGLAARIAHGPILYFGPGTRLRAKWISAARVLSDYSSKGASYLDLRVPERPAAGGLVATTPPPAPIPAPTAETPVQPAPAASSTPAQLPPTSTNPQPEVQPAP